MTDHSTRRASFHISKDGKARQCQAKTVESCTATPAGMKEHFETREAAEAAYEKWMSAKKLPTVSKKKAAQSKVNPDTAPQCTAPAGTTTSFISDSVSQPYKAFTGLLEKFDSTGDEAIEQDANLILRALEMNNKALVYRQMKETTIFLQSRMYRENRAPIDRIKEMDRAISDLNKKAEEEESRRAQGKITDIVDENTITMLKNFRQSAELMDDTGLDIQDRHGRGILDSIMTQDSKSLKSNLREYVLDMEETEKRIMWFNQRDKEYFKKHMRVLREHAGMDTQ